MLLGQLEQPCGKTASPVCPPPANYGMDASVVDPPRGDITRRTLLVLAHRLTTYGMDASVVDPPRGDIRGLTLLVLTHRRATQGEAASLASPPSGNLGGTTSSWAKVESQAFAYTVGNLGEKILH